MTKLHLNTTAPGRMQGEVQNAKYIGQLTGWNLEFCQLTPGEQNIGVRLAVGRRISLMQVRCNTGFHQQGTPPPGTLALGLPLKGMRDWLSRPFMSSSILPFSSAAGIDCVSEVGFEALSIAIDIGFLSEVSDTYQLPIPDYLLAPQSRMFIPPSASTSILTSTIAHLMAADTIPLGKEQEETLAVGLLQAALGTSCIEDKSSPATRTRALIGALEFIEQHSSDVITVGEICRATGASERTLRRAFLERFGISPKTYLRHIRLSQARDELSASTTDNSIADVANNLGFWHMGNFARDYQRVFGELPSQTWRQR